MTRNACRSFHAVVQILVTQLYAFTFILCWFFHLSTHIWCFFPRASDILLGIVLQICGLKIHFFYNTS